MKSKRSSSEFSHLFNDFFPIPFQNNPQLMSHDYAKSPLMEDVHNNDDTATGETIDEVIEVDLEETDDAISKFDPRTKQLFEPHKFAPKVTRENYLLSSVWPGFPNLQK